MTFSYVNKNIMANMCLHLCKKTKQNISLDMSKNIQVNLI